MHYSLRKRYGISYTNSSHYLVHTFPAPPPPLSPDAQSTHHFLASPFPAFSPCSLETALSQVLEYTLYSQSFVHPWTNCIETDILLIRPQNLHRRLPSSFASPRLAVAASTSPTIDTSRNISYTWSSQKASRDPTQVLQRRHY